MYLSWIAIETGRLELARQTVAPVRSGPTGSARDLALVTEAAILVRQGRADSALELLRPLRGKIVDPDERLLYGEEVVRAAILAKHYAEALDHLLDWLAHAPAEAREAVQAIGAARLERIPPEPLEKGLGQLEAASRKNTAASTLAPARSWLEKAVRARLTRIALEKRDGALARRLLESAPASLRRGSDGTLLSRIATSGSVLPRVAGRAVGFVLSIGDADVRRRSASAVAGISRALGLPRTASKPGAVRLLTRDDADAGGIEQALGELAGEGAAILVAGVDSAGAGTALRYADAASIPVIVLHHPDRRPSSDGFGFVLGAAAGEDERALAAVLQERGITTIARVGTHGAACDAQGPAGQPRFPVQTWKRERADALLLLGDASCARDAVAELSQAGVRPALAFGLECAELFAELDTPQPKLAASTGSFPFRDRASAPAALARWLDAAGGPPSWYEVLGRDAALLASGVLASFPLERVDDAREVTKLHQRARTALASSTAELWSSENRGFGGARVLGRKLSVVSREGAPVEPRPRAKKK